MPGNRVPIILDVDTGIDDALAIALAVGSPSAQLVAVTTLAGNVDVGRTTANSLAVLDWLGATDVPVHRGASHPLARSHQDAAFVHGTNGLGNAQLPESRRETGRDRGPAAMIRLASERPGELTLVCLGPLTNLAIALNVEPRLPEWLARVVIMGGAFAVPGNVTPDAEFNIFVDPEAAAQVLAAPFSDLTIVGLDVTHQTALARAVWDAAASEGTNEAQLVAQLCRRSFLERGATGFYLHDPLALAAALDSTLLTHEQGAVTVSTAADERGKTSLTEGGTVKVANGVDAPRFLREFYRALRLPLLEVDQAALRPE